MARQAAATGSDPFLVLVESFAVNQQINQMLIQPLDSHTGEAKPPGKRGRTIAAIFAHVHNIRLKWVRLSAPELSLPAPLGPARCTKKQATAALAASAGSCLLMIRKSFESPTGRTFLRDGWARPWPAGAAMVTYMISHEAHHRGQILMLAHQLGKPLPRAVGGKIWNWEKLWKDCGFTRPR